MTAAMLLGSVLPHLNPLFTPMTPAEQFQNSGELVLGVLEFCLAIAYFALWRAAPDFPVFRILRLFFAVLSAEQLAQYYGAGPIDWSLRAFAMGVLVETAGQAMSIPNRRWTRLFWPFYFLAFLGAWIPSLVAWRNFGALSEIPLAVFIYKGFRRGNRRDRLIAAALSLHFAVRLTIFPGFRNFTGIQNSVDFGGLHWRLTALTLTILGATTLALFVRDLVHDRREKQRLATELEAARAIQQLLIPEQLPLVAGFEIRSAYNPFGEVGGDFFQIIPLAEDSALIAIGDVSGKGLPAAMQVSLLVGTLRALAGFIQSPAALLTAANHHMLRHSNGGFTTCLILRIDPTGQCTVANAGHIAPYIHGAEFHCENGLPLGIASGVQYAESILSLPPDQQLTLLTDGVVESRNPANGELFGFDRTAAISTRTAAEIAQAAKQFGQEDDITVLTVAFAPIAEALHA
jgi:hypothetical protein